MQEELHIFWIYFLSPLFFVSIIFVPVIIYFFLKRQKYLVLNKNIITDIEHAFWTSKKYFSIHIGLISMILLVFILLLANPHIPNHKQKVTKNGIDIVLALDISKSMEATDLQPSRIKKAQEALLWFIEKQTTNRVGLIMFAWKPISSVPLTFDYNILKESITLLSTDSLSQNVPGLDGTAIWDALLMSKNMFEKTEKNTLSDDKKKEKIEKKKDSEKRKKVIILLTDGDANRWVDPIITSKLLKEHDITVYPLWIGSKEGWEIVFNNGIFPQKARIPPLNTKALKEVAEITWWYFFRATDNQSLDKIFQKLWELEKNDIEVTVIKRYSPFYSPFIYVLVILLWIYFFLLTRKTRI